MKNRRMISGIVSALGMAVLILDSRTALAGAREGLVLCIRTVIPSLFPFFLLSGMMVGNLIGYPLPLLRPLSRLLGMPQGTESLLVSGFLGGYPVGAACIRDAWAKGGLNKEDAEHMLSFCSNAGPSFLFGMIATQFSDPAAAWKLWGIHVASALLTGILFHKKPKDQHTQISGTPANLSAAMQNALRVTGQVCGWVILFRVFITFLQRWLLFAVPAWLGTAITGFLELANGCMELKAIADENLRFLLGSCMLSFGGLCVTMQTMSVTNGLSLRYYFSGKSVQTLFSLFLSLLCLGHLSPLCLILLPAGILCKKTGKRGRNPGAIPV